MSSFVLFSSLAYIYGQIGAIPLVSPLKNEIRGEIAAITSHACVLVLHAPRF